MVCHCLLIEADRGLVLVDSGFGLTDLARMRHFWNALRPSPRLGAGDTARRQIPRHAYVAFALRAKLDPEETAVRQVAALGHDPADVTDLVLTHLDLDHAGGLADFPRARVHVDRAEHDFATEVAASGQKSPHRLRYWPYQWAHGPDWVTYGPGGDTWLDFEGVRELDGLDGIALVPLPGHSPGQCGVTVAAENGWLMHAADAYFDHREVDPVNPRSTPGVAAFQKRLEFDGEARRESRRRLRDLAASHAGQVEFFCSHDPVELDRYR